MLYFICFLFRLEIFSKRGWKIFRVLLSTSACSPDSNRWLQQSVLFSHWHDCKVPPEITQCYFIINWLILILFTWSFLYSCICVCIVHAQIVALFIFNELQFVISWEHRINLSEKSGALFEYILCTEMFWSVFRFHWISG